MGSASGYSSPGIPGGRQPSLWLFQALLIAKSQHLSSLTLFFFICFVFTLALNRLALLQAQNQVAFLLFFSYLGSDTANRVLKENRMHFILAPSILKKQP